MSECLLNNAVILVDEPDPKRILNESLINRHREWVKTPDHWKYTIQMNLFKYADPLTKFNEVLSYDGKEVYLYRHRDGQMMFAESGAAIPFKLRVLQDNIPLFKEYPDRIILEFISSNPVGDPGLIYDPTLISDLILWFPDYNLSSPSAGNYSWLDEVSKSKVITGNYGSGSIEQINGLDVLHTISGNGTMSSNFPQVNEFTFAGILQFDYGFGQTPGACHNLDLFPFYFYAGNGLFSYYCYSTGVLKYRVEILEDAIFEATIVFITFKFENLSLVNGDALNMYMGGNRYKGIIQSMDVNKSASPYKLFDNEAGYWKGQIGEFMYWNRVLKMREINKIGQYLAHKYLLTWINL